MGKINVIGISPGYQIYIYEINKTWLLLEKFKKKNRLLDCF